MKYSIIFILLMGLVLSSGCGTRNHPPAQHSEDFTIESISSHYPVAITTYNSNKEKVTIVVKKAPQRVFALHQNSIETLLALGLGDRIVACAGDIPPIFKRDDYQYKEEFKRANYLSANNPSVEELLMMDVDCIIGWHSSFTEKSLGTTDFWWGRGVMTYIAENSNNILMKKTLEMEYKYILDIGKIFDREEQATAFVEQMEAEISRIGKVAALQKKQKTMVLELNNNKITVYGENQLAGDMVMRLGGDLLPSSIHVNYEELIALNPDVVFIAYMRDDGEKNVEKFLQTESLASISCIRNKRVYAIPLTYMYASGTRSLDGIRVFAHGLYPEM